MTDTPDIQVTTDQQTVTVTLPETPSHKDPPPISVASIGQIDSNEEAGQPDNKTASEAQEQIVQTTPLEGEVVEQKPKHPGGRPTKYNDEMLAKAKAYYHKCLGNVDGKKRMPFIEELALECDVNDETITEWTKIDEEFSATIQKLKNLQKLRTVQQGYSAKNPTFAIFMLKANHGMMETEKRVLAGERGSDPIQLNTVNYKDSTAKQIAEPIQQAVIEEGTE